VEPVVPLPPLAESDGFVRNLVGALSTRPELAQWLARDDLVQLFVVSVDNVAEGRSPRNHLGFLRPKAPFRVTGDPAKPRVDPASWARYDPIGDVVASLDPAATVQLYRELLPLFQQSYEQLGYPGRSFDARFHEAIEQLLATPVPEESPRVEPFVERYLWSDPALEALPQAQKQMLRMGPHNVERIQSKLREIRAALAAGSSPAAPQQGSPTAAAPPAKVGGDGSGRARSTGGGGDE
jgi:hypothetical protein